MEVTHLEPSSIERSYILAPRQPRNLRVSAYHLLDFIKLKDVKPLLSGKCLNSSARQIQVQYGPTSYLFVFRFGCFVFVGVSPEICEGELRKVRNHFPQLEGSPLTETYDIRPGTKNNVEFDHVELSHYNFECFQLIANTVAQSTALEYYENRTENMLESSGQLIRELSQRGTVPFVTKKLLKIIGSSAAARQHILSNLAVLDAPDETWDDESFESLHRALQDNFEIQLRSRVLDKKLTLVQDNIELMADFTHSRRGLLLETLIVLLIVLEIVIWSF